MESPPVTPEESHIVAHRSSSFTALRSLNKTQKSQQRHSSSNASPAPTRSSSMNNDKRSLPGRRKAMMVLFLAAVSISTIFVVKDLRFSGQSQQPKVDAAKRVGVLDDPGPLMIVDSPSPAQTDGEDSFKETGTANPESGLERLPSASDQSRVLTDASQNEQVPSFHASVQNGFDHSPPAGEQEAEGKVAPDALGGENAASRRDELRGEGAGGENEVGGQRASGSEDVLRGQDALERLGALRGQDAAKEEGVEIETEARVKRTGPRPCPVCYLPLPDAMGMRPPRGHTEEPILKHLAYVTEDDASERAARRAGNRPRFNGHQSLQQREDSFKIQESMRVHCGFVWGGKVGNGTGFDVSDDDRRFMERCYDIVVVSAIFGAYDVVQQPSNISEEARQQLCFVMFVDETTFNEFIRDGTLKQPRTRRVGLWRLVVVHNPPYRDPRRTGKIPKLLIHRLFPNVQFSMWVDAKLQLVQDPYMILERFLWRGNFSWAISKHYKRFDVFVEAEANKAAGKYRNASIDEQMEVYRSDGMTPFSEDKMPIISDVPEGCVIMREHTALSNLMACLWFNEVDRFTSRDQLSFGYTRDKICRSVPAWRLNMFLDCERRNFVVQVGALRCKLVLCGVGRSSAVQVSVLGRFHCDQLRVHEGQDLSQRARLAAQHVPRLRAPQLCCAGGCSAVQVGALWFRPAWRLNMFIGCERRNFVVQVYHKAGYHKDVLIQRLNAPPALSPSLLVSLSQSRAPCGAVHFPSPPLPSPLQGYHKDVLIQKLNGSSTPPALALLLAPTLPPIPPTGLSQGRADSEAQWIGQREEGSRQQLQQEGQHLNVGEKVEDGEEDGEEQEQERGKVERRLLGREAREGEEEWEGEESRKKRDFNTRDIIWEERWKDVDLMSGLEGEGNALTLEFRA
ncbi:unnamed protein product [Closterium sp. Naga37s-1]|nr:unnamed protein product [Closterium sp. Naga37s-1]